MTLPRLTAITNHWKNIPPVAVTLASLAHMFGVQVGEAKQAKTSKSSVQELFESALGAGFKTGRPEWLKKTKT